MRALEIVGERWTLLVIREAFYGVRRFDVLRKNVGCARNLLADRLATLVEHGVLAKTPYVDEGQRERFEYRLTEKGLALFPVIVSLMDWGDQWLGHQPPVQVLHRECGAAVHAELRCAEGHQVSSARKTEPRFTTRRARA
jgi:DNA-binding HxlR family transcriptional regulator